MDFLKERLKNLNQSNYDELLSLIDELLKLPESEQNRCWEQLVKQEFLENQLNKVVSKPDSKLLEFIANSCKNAICRKFFTKDFFIKNLLEFLDSDDFDLAKQTCRTIGNICYENEIGCQMIFKNDGIPKIVKYFELDKLDSTIEQKLQLKKIILGCLFNVLNDKSEYQQIAIDNDLINRIMSSLEIEKSKLNQDSIVLNCVLILFCFLDNESTMQSLKNFNLINALTDRIQNLNLKQLKTIEQIEQIDLEAVESIIDFLMQLSSNENEIKFKLVEKGIVELLIEILDHDLIEEEQILKTSSNLIVTLVSDESIAKKYFNNGKGIAFFYAKKWLDIYIEQIIDKSTDDELIEKEHLIKQSADCLNADLIEKDDSIQQKCKPKSSIKENTQLTTSALMIGNFSGNNEDSILIAKNNLIEKLIRIVECNEDFSIQFACLSTLRNLAIAEWNKKYFIDNGLLTRLLKLNYSESPSVVFKYLATLRLITDKQPDAASEIANDHKLIDDLKTWGNLDSLTGVKAEASRLLASLFKNLVNVNSNHNHLIDKQLLKFLFEMINSEHLKMQNEAINGIGFLINKFETNQIVNDLLKNGPFLKDIKSLLHSYTNKVELNEFEFKFICNVLSVLSFGYIKYRLEFDQEMYEQFDSLNANHSRLSPNVGILLEFKGKQS